jgi:serine protease
MRKFLMLAGVSSLLMACGNTAVKTTQHQPVLSSDGVVPGAILVDMKDNVSDSDIAELSKIAGTELHADNPTAQKWKFEEGIVDPSEEDAILDKLNADPRVEHAEKVVEYHALGFTPNDPLYKDQWGLQRSGAESSYNMNCGMGVTVAVVDTGIACLNDGGKIKGIDDLPTCEGGYNFVSNNSVAADDNGHGSHCSGTIAQLTNNNHGASGLAPCVKLMPVKVLAGSGSGTMEGVAEGIRFAADNGANVISLSLGSSQPSHVVEDAVNYAHDKGVLLSCANGNSGGSIGYPAAYPNCMGVSAIDSSDTIAKFSSRGPQTAIAAPGVNILQQTICDGSDGTDGCGVFKAFNGTSMACPHNSAAAALLYAQGITDPDAVKEKLQSTADPKEDPKLYGAGILRADKAVQSTILSHTLLRLLALVGILFLMRKVIKDQWKNAYTMAGVVFTGLGVVPLFFSGLMPRLGSFRIVAELLARPLGEMDITLGMGHNMLLLASAIPTAIATVLMLGHSKLKLLAGGIGLGSMALEAQILYSNDTRFMLGSIAMRVFMLVNMLICAYFVNGVFKTKQA